MNYPWCPYSDQIFLEDKEMVLYCQWRLDILAWFVGLLPLPCPPWFYIHNPPFLGIGLLLLLPCILDSPLPTPFLGYFSSFSCFFTSVLLYFVLSPALILSVKTIWRASVVVQHIKQPLEMLASHICVPIQTLAAWLLVWRLANVPGKAVRLWPRYLDPSTKVFGPISCERCRWSSRLLDCGSLRSEPVDNRSLLLLCFSLSLCLWYKYKNSSGKLSI